jgi:lipopolysaccharide export system protein LptA
MSCGNRLRHICAATAQVVISVSILMVLISSTLFPFPVFAEEKPEGVEGDRGSVEEVIDITADEISYDRRNAQATAKGNIVVLFKSFRITGDYAEYNENDLIVVIKGNARFEDIEEGTEFDADKIIFLLEEEEMQATGGISLNYNDGKVLASGEKLSYFGPDKRAIVEGCAIVEIAGKVFSASTITIFLDEERVLASGGTKTILSRYSEGL